MFFEITGIVICKYQCDPVKDLKSVFDILSQSQRHTCMAFARRHRIRMGQGSITAIS